MWANIKININIIDLMSIIINVLFHNYLKSSLAWSQYSLSLSHLHLVCYAICLDLDDCHFGYITIIIGINTGSNKRTMAL